MSTSAGSILARVVAGGRMSESEGNFVYAEATFEELAGAASAVRKRFAPEDSVTYLVDRNVNYTNVCITDCKFCEFYRRPGSPEAYVLAKESIARKLHELVAAGGTRVLLQGGHHPDLRLTYYVDLLRWIKTEFPSLEIDAFSPSEIDHIAMVESISANDVLQSLVDAGLGGVPGGGAEILDDRIRSLVSPKKISTARWLEIMELAHALRLYTSASQVFGFGEEPHHRIRALENLRAQQDRSLAAYGHGFMAFIDWPLLFESRYGEVFGGLKGWRLGGTPDDYLRHTAFCRIYLDNIPHFQASWPTMGLEVAVRALKAGCDDMGGTMMEENVVSQAGSVHCSVAENEVRAAVKAAGFQPKKRDSWYRLLEVGS